MKLLKKNILINKNKGLPLKIENLCEEKNLNRLFFKCFEAFIGLGKPILFVLAGNDFGTEMFQTYFQDEYLKRYNQNSIPIDIFLIENANHIYTLTDWQEQLMNKILAWIDYASPVEQKI